MISKANLRWSVLLALAGLALILLSLAALAYAFWPASVLQVHAPLAPTLFVAP